MDNSREGDRRGPRHHRFPAPVHGTGGEEGEDCEVGEACELVARVTLVTRVRLGKRVLVTVPFITTQAELAKRKRWRNLLIIAALVLIAIMVGLVHVFYMPLDVLLFKAMARFE